MKSPYSRLCTIWTFAHDLLNRHKREISSRQPDIASQNSTNSFLQTLYPQSHPHYDPLQKPDQLSFMTASPKNHALMLHIDHNSLLVSRSLVVHPPRRKKPTNTVNASMDLNRQNSPNMSSFFECTGSWVGAPVSLASFHFSLSQKGWATTPSTHTLQPSRLHHTPPIRRHARAHTGSPCIQRSHVRPVMSHLPLIRMPRQTA